MTNREFVKAVKLQTSDPAVNGTIASLTCPPGRKPSKRLLWLSSWYNQLGDEDKKMVGEALREAAEMAVFEFFCILDGVAAIEDTPNKGELELHFLKGTEKKRLNDPREEELHNVFNALCSEGVEDRSENPEISPYDTDEAADLKSRLKIGDELDIHHVPDKHLASQTIENYDPNSAPAIAIPKPEHRQISPERHR